MRSSTRSSRNPEQAASTRSRSRKQAEEEAPPKTRRSRTAQSEVSVDPRSAPRSGKRSRPGVEEEAPVRSTRGSRRSSKSAEDTSDVPAFDPYGDIDAHLDQAERALGLSSTAMDPSEKRQSTGTLANDILLGGGITAGWYTNFGKEQTCKTTDAITMLVECLNSDVPILDYWDFEGSGSPDYIENIMRNMGVKSSIRNIFGVRDDKGGWLVKPRVRYHTEAVAEKFFDYLARLQRSLPDKKKIGDQWWYVYNPKNSEGKINKTFARIVGDRYDKEYYRKTGLWRVPAKDGTLQAVVILDSYPAMLPERQDVDDPNSSMASQARMFADQLRRVKGKVKPKRIAILGINQLRLRPAVMMGNPEYEPGGEALKLYCFAEDTTIFTDSGVFEAKSLVGQNFEKVLGVSGLEQPFAYKHMGVKPVSSVHTEYGYSMRGRSEHAVLALREGQINREFVKLSDLSPQHYVAVKYGSEVWASKPPALDFSYVGKRGQGTNQAHVKLKFPSSVSLELCRLAGYLVGEGHCRENTIMFSNTDVEVFEDFLHCLRVVFNMYDYYLNRKISVVTHENSYKDQFVFSAYSVQVGEFLSYLGLCDKSSRDKTVPWFVLQSPREYVCEFLRSLFEVEGWVSKTGNQINISSSSQRLMKQVQLLLLNMGILGSLSRYKIDWLDKEYVHRDTNKYASICLYGSDLDLFNENIGFITPRKQNRLDQHLSLAQKDNGQDFADRMPKVFGTGRKAACFAFIEDHLDLHPNSRRGGRKHLRISEMQQRISYARGRSQELRTSQERTKNFKLLDELEDLVAYTLSNNLIWVKVESLDHNQEPVSVFDFNMPETHTVVTDGIVSHNSDVRLQHSERALSAVSKHLGEVVKGKGRIEEEPSVQFSKGVDSYRYIHVRAHKNKLSRPFLETYLRLWITDAKGNAQGFDPVFDVFQYLKFTGQLSGPRRKILLKFKGNEATKAIGWLDFKRLILSDNRTVKEICLEIGMKPVRLREACFKQMASGKGIELYNEYTLQGGKDKDGDGLELALEDEDD